MANQTVCAESTADQVARPVSELTADERRELVKQLAREVSGWSAELNRRLA